MSVLEYIRDTRILVAILIVLMLGIADIIYGIHFGVEFIGGTQIPITLEHSVNPDTMSSLINTLQQRISTFGLKQVTIEGVGSSEVYIIIPTVSKADVNSTIAVIEKQGIFQGIVNGMEALNGSYILGGTSGIQPTYTASGGNVTWSVSFYISQAGAQNFARVAFKQANKPLYMFLDRPTSSILLLNQSLLGRPIPGLVATGMTQKIKAIQNATAFGNSTIPIELLSQNQSNWNTLYNFFNQSRGRYTTVILAKNSPSFIANALKSLNYTLQYNTNANMTPQFIPLVTNNSQASGVLVSTWPAIGLLSAPILNPQVTNGNINEGYVVTGSAPVNLTLQAKINFAKNESATIASVLSGGALPVHVIVGLPITTPATLGKHFEIISAIALVLAIFAVAITIVIRYRKIFLILPILMTTVAELFIIVSVIGLIGTIDLSAVAGMIAVIGTGVDAQIIITDETLLGGTESAIKTKLSHAFYIVWADAVLLIIAMLPLLFSSSLVTVIGFAESTILGGLLGAFLTRPAYGAIVTRHYSKIGSVKNG